MTIRELQNAIVESFKMISDRNSQQFKAVEERINKRNSDSVELLKTELNELKTQFSELTKKLSQEVPSTNYWEAENTGPSGKRESTGI